MMTDRAFLGGIGRINVDHTNTGNRSLVVYELSELIETPRTMFMSLCLGSDRCPLSDATEIFKGYQRRGVFGFHDKFLRDAMIDISLKPSLMARKFLKMFFGTISATTLKIGFECIKFGSCLIDLLTRKHFSHRIHGYVLDSKINTENFFGYRRLVFRNFNYNAKIELFVHENQIGLPSDPVHFGSMVVTDFDRNLDPTMNGQERNRIKSFPRKDSLVVDNRPIRIKDRLDRLISFICFTCFRNGSNRHLRGYVKLLSDISINNGLQLDFIGCMHIKSNFGHIITSCIELMHRLVESFSLLRFNYNFDFESLHHDSIGIYDLWFKYLTSGTTQFLRTLKDAASLGDEVKRQQRTRAEIGKRGCTTTDGRRRMR
jgi:hypothetical protein